MDNVREPCVSGMFYPGDVKTLKSSIEGCLAGAVKHDTKGSVIGAIVPHAGYVYSGTTACYVYGSVNFRKKKLILLGPNHDSYPFYSAVSGEGVWKTPLGESRVRQELLDEVVAVLPSLKTDNYAHASEHSLEVQIPFLQYVTENDFDFVPVVLGDQSPRVAETLSIGLVRLLPDYTIIASSDLNHYEAEKVTVEKDKKLIDAITSLDVERFYSTIMEQNATPCGYAAIAALMGVTKKVGGRIMLLHHTTSASASGDTSHVVGYAALLALKD